VVVVVVVVVVVLVAVLRRPIHPPQLSAAMERDDHDNASTVAAFDWGGFVLSRLLVGGFARVAVPLVLYHCVQ
jgi:hypothetical protein